MKRWIAAVLAALLALACLAALAETPALEDGTYTATFTTDHSMFHVNEAYDNKGTLTVKDGVMTIHVTLASKNIVNLFPGLAEDAEKEGAALLEPTTDTVNYNDGTTGEVYGFDGKKEFKLTEAQQDWRKPQNHDPKLEGRVEKKDGNLLVDGKLVEGTADDAEVRK